MEKFVIFYKKRPISNPAYAKANYTLKNYEAGNWLYMVYGPSDYRAE